MGKRIEKVLDGFDFEEVTRYMNSVDWRWAGIGVPNIEQTKSLARDLLKRAKKARSAISTGGFIASYRNDQYSLIFYIDHSYED